MADYTPTPITDAITDIKVHVLTPNGNSKVMALASITLDLGDEFQMALHGIRVVEGAKGLFLGFPQREGSDGKWYDHYHPISGKTRDLLTVAVIEAYEKAKPSRSARGTKSEESKSEPSGGNRRGRR